MDSTEALRGIDQRIGALLDRGRPPPLTGAPIASPRMPESVLPPGDPGRRVFRGVRLLVPPGVDPFALFAGDWQAAGFRPRSWVSPDGPVLTAADHLGFVLVLQHHAGQVELYVISPALYPEPRGTLVGGLVVGAALGFVGPCFSMMALVRTFEDQPVYLAFLPLILLLGGGLLLSPGSRRFGTGLLIGGATVGIVSAGVCASMIS